MRNFDCATESKGNYLYQPYDFLLMSARIPRAWKLFLMDSVAERHEVTEIWAKLESQKPQIVVVSLADTNWKQDKDFLQKLRVKFPMTALYVCGDAFWEASSCLEVESLCDGIIDNVMTVDFERLAERDVSSPGMRSPPYNQKNFKKPQEVRIGIPRHEVFLNPSYRWPFTRFRRYTTVFTAWGCPYACSYCIMRNFPNIWRPYDEILLELRRVKDLGIKEIYIGDRSFGLPVDNVKKLLKEMIRENFKFSWSTYFRVDQYDPELFELMKESGCHTIIVGFESANFENLKKLGRTTQQHLLQKMLDHAKLLGIDVCGDFILGLLGENEEDLKRTIEMSKSLDIQYASFNIAAPLAGTSIRERAIQESRLEAHGHGYDSLGSINALSSDVLPGPVIKKIRNQAVREFYLRPKYLLERLTRTKSPEHFAIQMQEGIQLLKKTLSY